MHHVVCLEKNIQHYRGYLPIRNKRYFNNGVNVFDNNISVFDNKKDIRFQ